MTETKQTIRDLKKKILYTSVKSKEGHLASSFSILDILWILYDRIISVNPQNSHDPDRDIFILSKGHASLGLYAVLAAKGFFNGSTFDSFCSFDSILGGHPNCNKVPGVEASTGSLGHGMPIAVGMALGFKIERRPNKVFVLIGDGESNEGTIWESALLATHHKLDNLCCIIDHNNSSERALSLGDLEEKFKAFGWQAISIDGHDHEQIVQACRQVHVGQPLVIIAHTIKGQGASIMENNPAWHHRSPNQEELDIIIEELSKP